MTAMYSRGLSLIDELEIAADPDASDWQLRNLTLRNLTVWASVAARTRVSRAVRDALVATAAAGAVNFEGRGSAESFAEFEERWARTVCAVPWLTRSRLLGLAPQLARVARGQDPTVAASLTVAVAGHRSADIAVVARYLYGLSTSWLTVAGSPRDAALDALETLPHPWPLVAGFGRMHPVLAAASNRLGWSLGRAAGLYEADLCRLEGLDALSGHVLLGLLPSWRSTFPDAVAAARDITGNPDPAAVAERFPGPLTADQARRVLELAEAPDTTVAQLGFLPVDHLAVWRRVADRDDLTSDLRRNLYQVAREGPTRMRGWRRDQSRQEWATEWAQTVLSAPFLTAHRLTKLGTVAAVAGADPVVLATTLAAHPRATLHAVAAPVHALRYTHRSADGPSPVTTALAALAAPGGGDPWRPLAEVLTELRTVRGFLPEWKLELVDVPTAGRRLDGLRLPPAHLTGLLRLLPLWQGDLAAAVRRTDPS